jgi:hypothetical protein
MAPNLLGPLTIERNIIRTSSLGVYGNMLCMKVGNGGTGTAYLTANRCDIRGQVGLSGDGISQTNSGIGGIVARGNVIRATRYVVELTSVPGGSFDEDCLYTSDSSRFIKWGGTRYYSLTEFRAATRQEMNALLPDECLNHVQQ